MASNFDFLAKYWPDMAQLGKLAELYLYADANACIFKLGLLAERVAQEICVLEKLDLPRETGHADRLRTLKYADLLPQRVDDMFYTLRRARNDAVHAGLDSQDRAVNLLQLGHGLCCWFMEVYGDWEFTAQPYAVPANTDGEELTRLLAAQEAKIQELTAAVEAIRTAASEAPKEVRAEKAQAAAKELPLTDGAGDDPVRMDAQVLSVLNYAMQQNGADAILSITLENTTDGDLEQLELTISATPAFALPFTRHIDLLPAHKSVTISRPKVLLDGAFLSAMTEKVAGVLQLQLTQGDTVLATEYAQTRVLAFDEWHGLGTYPELLSAFVTPNHPEIARILARATEFLGKWTSDTSMDGYQSQDPNRVLQQSAAIFTALKEEAIAYINPPASFEGAGQRVRLSDMVLQQKLGTCLDLTLLYASCLEAVGLHPILITTVGHIFTGIWLEEKHFPECVQDDFSLITKRLASGINEIAVVETTAVTTGKDRSFDEARALGEENMTKLRVEYIIDVHRARLSGIAPLPQRVRTASGWVVEHDTKIKRKNLAAPTKLEQTIDIDPGSHPQDIPKKVQWERKLLDLGMRNTLLNLRFTRSQLPILTASLDELENALNDGQEYTILPRPSDLQVTATTFETLYESGSAGIVRSEFANRRLRTVLTETELNKVIKELYRTSKTALEENGANTLYLALGMLRWFENKRSTKARYAPIILLPIEMVRKSAAQGYAIRLRDEEPQMNVTLLEKLKQDFGIQIHGVDPLPMEERGVDIRRVLTILRKAVMDQSHWDVLEAASIGIFSFSQFVMWNDIRNRTEDLLENKVVRSLMEGKLSWDAQPLEMGDKVNENNVLLPMPADASQLYAIQAACSGESFVLHGPPGTGKSQTITSLIANALAQGRSVLFVAEKMAALEVVQKRLDKIGIGPFCLELHSNKSKKKDVLEQLRQATEVTKTKTAAEYAAKAQQLAALRAELDEYARQLHSTQNCGRSLHALINEYEGCADAADIAPFDPAFVAGLTKLDLDSQQLTVERMIAAAREIGNPAAHPLRLVGCRQYSQSIRTGLQAAVEGYRAQLQRVRPHALELPQLLSRPQPDSAAAMEQLASAAEQLACWYDLPAAWARTEAPQFYFEEIGKLSDHSLRANSLKSRLLSTFDPSFLNQSGEALLAQYMEVSSKWFLSKMMGVNKLTKTVAAYAKGTISRESVKDHLTALRDYQQEARTAQTLLEKYGPELGNLYRGEDTDWAEIAGLAENASRSSRTLAEQKLQAYAGKPEAKVAVLGLRDAMPAFREAKAAFDNLLGILQTGEEHWLEGQLTLCDNILTHCDQLKEWIAYTAAAEEARTIGLGNVAACCDSGSTEVERSYRKALLQGLIAQAIDASETLNQFSGAVFNEKIQQYKRMDQQWAQLSQQEVYCRLASKVPNFTREAAHSSELGILQRCIKSGGRGTSIRRLFDQIPNLLPRLCPCMLMSPISAAQYLDPKREPFDIVVFDEASQLPTCKAVGVLARGKDAVIVGDPKQMPPTSFFATSTVDEDNLEAEDLESILDDCLALNMPQSHLLWHYRSRHESLIAFSNSQFYENKLFTFPSVNDRESKVRLQHVEGVFDRGKTRTNRAEAEAVVAEIKRRYQDPEHSKESLGVVTFNISQQHLIDDLLTEAYTQDPGLEAWACGAEEPLFIKNLENVQGDERDVILFSIGFGPDEQGKVYMNFGPLNRDGGWRRLNVAVSRARCEMMVFSTLRSEQLDMNRTKAEGVAALRSFLEYAEGRSTALAEGQPQKGQGSTEGIAAAICGALEEKGYETDRNVGRSEYRIDIGVVDPRDPDKYMLGILLDGSSYGSAKTTRDREVAQIGVLQGLGWNILRVWSMDWWDNREKELERILQKLQELPTEAPAAEPEPAPAASEAPKLAGNAPKEKPRTVKAPPLYKAAILPPRDLSSDEFVEARNVRSIESRIKKVLEAEAPVSRAVLIKRVVQSCGISRAGSRIQGHLSTVLYNLNLKTTGTGEAAFYWRADQNPEAYAGFRVSGDGENRRDAQDVPPQEVANAIYTVLYEQVSMAQEDLLREAAKKLGYTRLGGKVLGQLALGIRCAEEQGGITLGNSGTYVLTPTGTARAEDTLQSF